MTGLILSVVWCVTNLGEGGGVGYSQKNWRNNLRSALLTVLSPNDEEKASSKF